MRLTTRARLGMASALALAGGLATAAPGMAAHQTVTGLTNEAPSRVVQFAVGSPGTLIGGPTAITFPMGATDTDLVGLDYRPRGGNLFAQGSQGTIYVLDPPAAMATNWTATRVSAPVSNPFSGTPTDFGFDFNPTVDRIRVVNDEPGSMTTANNYRFNPNNGALVATDGDLAYAAGDPNAGESPRIVAAGYTNNFDGATATTLYDIDAGLDILATQIPPNDGTLNTVGALGVDTTDVAGFDIEGGTGTAYAALQAEGDAESTFYRLDLASGAATATSSTNAQIGPDGTPPVESVSLVPTSVLRFANAVTPVAEDGGTASVTVYREGPLNRTSTVNWATELAVDDTAAAADFTASMGTLTFAPGDAAETITVPIANDAAQEPEETFTVRLSAPNTASNLPTPPTAKVNIVDDDGGDPGAPQALVAAPPQTLKQVLQRKELRFRYSCNEACVEESSLRLKGAELGRSSSSLDRAGAAAQVVALDGDARRALRTAPGRGGVRVKLVSVFTDADDNVTEVTTRLRLRR
jgi:hypothetical protein